MKHFARTIFLFAAALGLTAASAIADTFAYSYDFVGNYNTPMSGAGHTVSGTFDGTAAGNLITGVTNATLKLDGIQLFAGTVYALGFAGSSWTNGAAVMSFDGTQNNFTFSDQNFAATGTFNVYFQGLSGAPYWSGLSEYALFDTAGLPGHGGNQYVDFYQPSTGFSTPNGTWTVTSASSVPDTGATIALLGGSLLALAALRRRFIV